MDEKIYLVVCIETKKEYLWSKRQMIRELNRDRSGDWLKYNKTDWEEGWDHFVEGNHLTWKNREELREALTVDFV